MTSQCAACLISGRVSRTVRACLSRSRSSCLQERQHFNIPAFSKTTTPLHRTPRTSLRTTSIQSSADPPHSLHTVAPGQRISAGKGRSGGRGRGSGRGGGGDRGSGSCRGRGSEQGGAPQGGIPGVTPSEATQEAPAAGPGPAPEEIMTDRPSQTSPEPTPSSSTVPGLVEQPGQISPDRTPRASPGISTTGLSGRTERPSSPEDSEETRVEGGRPPRPQLPPTVTRSTNPLIIRGEDLENLEAGIAEAGAASPEPVRERGRRQSLRQRLRLTFLGNLVRTGYLPRNGSPLEEDSE